jgi:hypothetical protein
MADILSELKVTRESCGAHIPAAVTQTMTRAEQEITDLRRAMSLIADELKNYLDDSPEVRSDATIAWCLERTGAVPRKKDAAA